MSSTFSAVWRTSGKYIESAELTILSGMYFWPLKLGADSTSEDF